MGCSFGSARCIVGCGSLLPEASRSNSVIPVNKGLLILLAFVFALHAGIGCGVAQAAPVIEAPCCGNHCPMGAAIGESACCHAHDSGVAAQEISRSSLPSVHPLVGLMPVSVMSPARTVVEAACLFEAGDSGAVKLALLCSRQI